MFTESLGVRFAVRIEEFLAALLPRRFEFWGCDVPVRPAFLGNGTEVLPELFQRRPAKEPVAVVNLVNDKTGLEHNRVRNHRIVARIGVLSDVEIFLDLARRVGEKRPARADSGAKLIRLGDVVRANRDQPAIAYLELTVKLEKSFMLPAILGTITSAAENENRRMLSLEFRELPTLRRVIGKLVIGEHSS